MVGGDGTFADSMDLMKSFAGKTVLRLASQRNTVLGVVATNAALTKEQVNFVAQMAHDGIARSVRPAHTMLDGDTIFALSTGKKKVDVNVVGAYAAEAIAQAIVHAVVCATSIGGVPARRDLVDLPVPGWQDPPNTGDDLPPCDD
jgi:L-aminopeptidase/D-esterase-like protein